jgi:hypothetical protein
MIIGFPCEFLSPPSYHAAGRRQSPRAAGKSASIGADLRKSHRRIAMASAAQERTKTGAKVDARAAMEALNAEAGPLNIWLRTQANAPAQRPWFRDTGIEAAGELAGGRVGKAQVKAAARRR